MSKALETNKSVYDKFMKLIIPSQKCQVTYIWIDGTGENLRSKTKTVEFIPKKPQGNFLKVFK